MSRFNQNVDSIDVRDIALLLPKDAREGAVVLKVGNKSHQRIEITSTPSNLRGFIRLLLCPGCNHKVRTLYVPVGKSIFLCRQCHNLKYLLQTSRAYQQIHAERKTLLMAKDTGMPQ